MVHIILLAGGEGVGKSTLAAGLVSRHKYKEISFADSLRRAAVATWNGLAEIQGLPCISYDMTLDPRSKESPIPGCEGLTLLGRTLTPRVILQWFGTDVMRNIVADDIWVHSTLATIQREIANGETRFVISDWRFENEYTCLAAFAVGRTDIRIERIRLERGDVDDKKRQELAEAALAGHPSARGWVTMPCDKVLRNPRTLPWILETVDELAR